MSDGFGGVDPGGPDSRFGQLPDDQDQVEVVVNISSFRFSQTGKLGSGGLVRWRVLRNGIPVKKFLVYPYPRGGSELSSLPLVTDTRAIPGRAGLTHWIQVTTEPGNGRQSHRFGIRIDGVASDEWVGVLETDTGTIPVSRKKPPAKTAKSAAKNKM